MSSTSPTTLSQALAQIKLLSSQLNETKDAFDTLLSSKEEQMERRIQLIRSYKTSEHNEEFEVLERQFREMRKASSFNTKAIYNERKGWEKERLHLSNTIKNLKGDFERQIKDHDPECTGRKRENKEWRERAIADFRDIYNASIEDESSRLRVENRKLREEVSMQKGVIKVLHKEILKGKQELKYHTQRHEAYCDTIQELRIEIANLTTEKERERKYLKDGCVDAERFSALWREATDRTSPAELFDSVKDMFVKQTVQIRDAYVEPSLLKDEIEKREQEIAEWREKFLDIENELDRVLFFELRARLKEPEYEQRIDMLSTWADFRDAHIDRLEEALRDKTDSNRSDEILGLTTDLRAANSLEVSLREEISSLRDQAGSLSWKLEKHEETLEEKPKEESWRRRSAASSLSSSTMEEIIGDDEQLVRVARQAKVKGVEECNLFPGVGKIGEPVVCEVFSVLRKIYPECYFDAEKNGEMWMAVPKIEGPRLGEEEDEGKRVLERGQWPKQQPRPTKDESRPAGDEWDDGNWDISTEWGAESSDSSGETS